MRIFVLSLFAGYGLITLIADILTVVIFKNRRRRKTP